MPCFDPHIWANGFLGAMGNSNPSANTVKFVLSWMQHENSFQNGSDCNACDYNGLNMGAVTNNPPPGVIGYCVMLTGTFGICKFDSMHDAILATSALVLSGYPNLAHALITNNEKMLGFGAAMDANVAAELEKWSGNSPGYAAAIIRDAGGQNISTTPGGTSGSANGDVPQPNQSLPNQQTGAGSTSFDWNRIAKGAIGAMMLLAGLSLLVKAITPPQVVSAVTTAAKAIAA